jgi:hypothetical protein
LIGGVKMAVGHINCKERFLQVEMERMRHEKSVQARLDVNICQ